MAKSVSYAVSSREINIIQRAFRPLVEGDTAYDTDFAMFYTLYHIFKQESIQGRGTIKDRGMIKCRHTTVFTKYIYPFYKSIFIAV